MFGSFLLLATALEAAQTPATRPAATAAPTATPTAAPTAAPTPDPRKVVSLETLVKDALENNLTLSAARATTRGTETAVGSAKGAFDPTLDFSPSYNRTRQELLAAGPTTLLGTAPGNVYSAGAAGQLPISTSYSLRFDSNRTAQDNPLLLQPGTVSPTVNNTLTFSLAQPLLRGFGPTYANAPVDLAQFTAEAARARLQRTADQTIADVEIAYWSLGLAEAIERLSRDSYDRSRDLLGRNEKMLELKLISELDAITSRRGVEQRLTSLTDAVRRRQDAAERLLFLVYGRKAPERLAERDSIRTEAPPADVALPLPLAELEREALGLREDYSAARTDLSQSQLLVRVNKNALLPDLRLTGTYTAATLNTDAVRLFNPSREGDLTQTDWKVGVSFSYPIRNRTARAAYALARYDAEASAENLVAFENIVRSQVRAAARAIEANRLRLEQAQRSFDYAKQQYDAGQKQLQLGLLDSFRLLQMEEEVSGAEQVLETTRYDLALALTDYGLATGAIDRRYGAPAVAR